MKIYIAFETTSQRDVTSRRWVFSSSTRENVQQWLDEHGPWNGEIEIEEKEFATDE